MEFGVSRSRVSVALSIAVVISLSFLSQSVLSHNDELHFGGTATGASHAPIGVMGDHLHQQGEVMLSYRYMRMKMEGNRIGSDRISAADIVGTRSAPGQFMVAPTKMPMDMHMLGLMYAPSDNVTLMAMANIHSNNMDHVTRMGGRFSTESSGLGDTKVSALISLLKAENHRVHVNLGVSLPTGSIDERDDTPAQENAFLPYPMQLGSGTYDLLAGATYRGSKAKYGWGAQISSVLRLGDNDESYTLGDRVTGSAWLQRNFNANIAASLRLQYQDCGNIDGANSVLNPRMVQTANTHLQGGDRTDLLIGLNYLFTGALKGHRLAVEYGRPIKQTLDGPQLETDKTIIIGWQKAF